MRYQSIYIFLLVGLFYPYGLVGQDDHEPEDKRPYPPPEISEEDSIVNAVFKKVSMFNKQKKRGLEPDTLQTRNGERVLAYKDTFSALEVYDWSVRYPNAEKDITYYIDAHSRQIVLARFHFVDGPDPMMEKYIDQSPETEYQVFINGSLRFLLDEEKEIMNVEDEALRDREKGTEQHLSFHLSQVEFTKE